MEPTMYGQLYLFFWQLVLMLCLLPQLSLCHPGLWAQLLMLILWDDLALLLKFNLLDWLHSWGLQWDLFIDSLLQLYYSVIHSDAIVIRFTTRFLVTMVCQCEHCCWLVIVDPEVMILFH